MRLYFSAGRSELRERPHAMVAVRFSQYQIQSCDCVIGAAKGVGQPGFGL
jgi:hypothetical protein